MNFATKFFSFSNSATLPAPVRLSERVQLLDILRGIALLGILACNIMAFSNYLGQSIFCSLFFHGYGLGQFGKLERYELYYVVAVIAVFQLIFSNIWLHYFSLEPLEWIWRSLTYGKTLPIRRSQNLVAEQ